MREGVSFVRERGRPAPAPAPGLAAFLGRHRPTWAISGAGGLLLAGVDAFGSGGAPPLTLYSYWVGMMLATGLLTAILVERLEREPALAARPLALSALMVVGIAVAMTPFVWIVAALVLGGSPRPAKMATIFPQALLILTAFVALQWAMERRRPPPQAKAFPPLTERRPALLDRLPEKLKGADLHAIEAEDHYLRLHTERGSALILMRLADAMEELGSLEGARTHRSWWVARSAILHASRGRGRAVLKLKGGIEAPVSRTYAPSLRRAGWF
jgi:hypothetical protein